MDFIRSKAAGIILYRDNPRKYLLLYKPRFGHPEFAKGKIEENENTVAAARREVREETGLKGIKLIPGFEKHIRYKFIAKDAYPDQPKNLQIRRTVTFFLGKAPPQKIRLSKEHKKYKWASPEEALKELKHGNYKRMIRDAEKLLNT